MRQYAERQDAHTDTVSGLGSGLPPLRARTKLKRARKLGRPGTDSFHYTTLHYLQAMI